MFTDKRRTVEASLHSVNECYRDLSPIETIPYRVAARILWCYLPVLLLPLDIGKAERLLAIVLNLQFTLLVELHLAQPVQQAGTISVLVDVKGNDTDGGSGVLAWIW